MPKTTGHFSLLRSFSSLAGANVLGQAIGFLALAYITRRVTQSQLGSYSLAVAIAAYFSIPANLGISIVAIRDIAKSPSDTWRIGSEGLILLLSLNGFAFVVLVIFAHTVALNALTAALLPIAGLGLLTTALLLDWILQARGIFKSLAWSRILGQVIYAIIVFGAISAFHSPIIGFAYANVVGSSVTTIAVGVVAVRKFGVSLTWPHPSDLLRRFRRGVGAGFSILTLQFYLNLAIVLLGVFATTNAIAEYTVANKIPVALVALSPIMNSVIYPRVASASRDTFPTVRQEIGHILSLTTGLSIILWGLVAVNGSFILATLFGGSYGNAGPLLAVLTAVASITFINMTLGGVLIGRGYSKELTGTVALGVLIQSAASIFLIPIGGALGAAGGLLVAEIVVCAAISFQLVHLIGSVPLLWRRIVVAAGISVFTIVLGILPLYSSGSIRFVLTGMAVTILCLVFHPIVIPELRSLVSRSQPVYDNRNAADDE